MILIAGDSFGQIPKNHGEKDTDHWCQIYAKQENLDTISIAEPGGDIQKTIFDTVKYISDNKKNAYAIKECFFFATSPYRLHRSKTNTSVNYGEWHRQDVHFKECTFLKRFIFFVINFKTFFSVFNVWIW